MRFFQSRKFFIQNLFKHHVFVFFKQSETEKKCPIFDENHEVPPQGKWAFSHNFRLTFLLSRKLFFIKNIIKHHVQVFFKEIETQKNFKVFDENHGLTPFEKWTLFHYVSMTFLLCRKPFFTFRTLLSIMCHYFF